MSGTRVKTSMSLTDTWTEHFYSQKAQEILIITIHLCSYDHLFFYYHLSIYLWYKDRKGNF